MAVGGWSKFTTDNSAEEGPKSPASKKAITTHVPKGLRRGKGKGKKHRHYKRGIKK